MQNAFSPRRQGQCFQCGHFQFLIPGTPCPLCKAPNNFEDLPPSEEITPIKFLFDGFTPIPLYPNSKRPAVKWSKWGPTQERLAEFLKHEVNWGLRTGQEHNLYVIDIDPQNGGNEDLLDFPELMHAETVRSLTPNGGTHIWFRPNGQSIPSFKLAPGIEFLGERHLSVEPPSQGYCFEIGYGPDEIDIASLPGWICDMALGKEPKPKGPTKWDRHWARLPQDIKEKTAEILRESLPDAKRYSRGRKMSGSTDPHSKRKGHIQVDIDKGLYNDFHLGEKGGTILGLLKRIGAPIPDELKDMGKAGIPEYLPIWIIGKDWQQKGYKCGETYTVITKDGTPIYTGPLFCLSWGCPECTIKLINIQKAKLRQVPTKKASKIYGDKREVGKILSKIKRKCPEFERKVLRGTGYSWVLIGSNSNVDNIINNMVDMDINVFDVTQEEVDQMVNDLPYADVGPKKKRTSASRGFGKNNNKPNQKPNQPNKPNSNIYKDNNISHDNEVVIPIDEGPKIEAVILESNPYREEKAIYQVLVKKMETMGLTLIDTSGEGICHRIFGDALITGDDFMAWGFMVREVIPLSLKRGKKRRL